MSSSKDENTENNKNKDMGSSAENGEIPENIHETNGFIFIYEYNGKVYQKLRYVHPSAGESVIIHPVYYSGYNNTMTSEELKWNHDTGKFVTTSTDGSWLDTLKNYKDMVYPIETSEVIFHDGHYYHCEGCLLESLVGEFTIVSIEPRPEGRNEGDKRKQEVDKKNSSKK